MIEDVFENLVGQFSDPFTFYRELIQNAMDAGSGRVDVTVDWLEEKGMVLVTVSDSGEGMTQEIIQSKLTRLFSSTKEDDFTKIGKFGIGFVSVFAIAPELVLVDTGRDGEFYRIAFDGTTDYKILRLEWPIEGTSIRVYKRLNPEDLAEFERRSQETIAFWCCHSENEITFNGETINQRLEVDSPCQVYYEGQGTQIVAGYTSSALPEFGMYNQGLTLKVGKQDQFPGVTYKIKSRYLEHTLTRDNVLEDENYEKAFKLLTKVVRQQLSAKFQKQVVDLIQAYPETSSELANLMACASPVLSRWRDSFPPSFVDQPLFPVLHGPPLSINDARRAAAREGCLYIDDRRTEVSHRLHQEELPVFWAHPASSLTEALRAVTGSTIRIASREVATPVPGETPPALKKIGWNVVSLLRRGSVSVLKIQLADFHYEGSSVSHLPCLAQHEPGEPIRLYDRGFWSSLQKYPGVLLYNQRHPLVRKALAQVEHSPLLASFVLAKAALLQDGLPDSIEAKIAGRAAKIRS